MMGTSMLPRSETELREMLRICAQETREMVADELEEASRTEMQSARVVLYAQIVARLREVRRLVLGGWFVHIPHPEYPDAYYVWRREGLRAALDFVESVG